MVTGGVQACISISSKAKSFPVPPLTLLMIRKRKSSISTGTVKLNPYCTHLALLAGISPV